MRRVSRHKRDTDVAEQGWLLLVCEGGESGAHARMMQSQLAAKLGCEVVIASDDDAALWREDVARATHGVVVLQTKNVLRHPFRLLQLFTAERDGLPLVCVSIVGGATDPHRQRRGPPCACDSAQCIGAAGR